MNVSDRRSPTYVAVLAVAAGLILILGWLLRPRDIPQSPPAVPSETELQELGRRAQRRALENTAAYFADLATDLRPSLVYVPSSGASGIAWDESHIVTGPIPIENSPATVTVLTAAGERRAAAITSRRLPLSVLSVGLGQSARVPRRATSMPQTGDWVVAVWQTDHAPSFAAATFRQLATPTCGIPQAREFVVNIPLTRAMTGGGVFSMDRELLAAILPCGDHVAALAPSSIDDMLTRVATIEERLLASYGVLFSSLSQEERRYFSDADGLLVREVWLGTRGDEAGLQAGDVVVALNGHDIAAIDDLRPLTAQSETRFELRARRGSKTQTVTFDASARPPGISRERGARVGLVVQSATPTFRIESVLPDSRAARAGVKTGDVIRQINHVEPRTRAEAARALTIGTSEPILLEIERDQRRLAIVIPEGTER